jgi:hypothetical protein
MYRQKGQHRVWKIEIIITPAIVGIMLLCIINNTTAYYTQI